MNKLIIIIIIIIIIIAANELLQKSIRRGLLQRQGHPTTVFWEMI